MLRFIEMNEKEMKSIKYFFLKFYYNKAFSKKNI